MSKVVYLLGAEASYGTRSKDDDKTRILSGLPIVKEIEGELENLTRILSSLSLGDKELEESKQNLIKDFQYLKVACSDNATIDTYAKKLWLQGKKDDFSHVELLLTIFFIFEQIVHKPDKRYDTFFANVLERKMECYEELTLPDEIRILSWNYDNQLELVYREYLKRDYAGIRDVLGVYDVKGDGQEESLPMNCNIVKLNGTANFVTVEDWLQYSETSAIDENILSNILRKYSECLQVGSCNGRIRLNFAWEERWSRDMLNKTIPNMVQDATALVVIGYTFPYFNRKIDRMVFAQMPNLKNIYIQDPEADRTEQYIKPVIPEMLADVKIHPLKDTDQFFLPPEL
jgi:hypothetical protein